LIVLAHFSPQPAIGIRIDRSHRPRAARAPSPIVFRPDAAAPQREARAVNIRDAPRPVQLPSASFITQRTRRRAAPPCVILHSVRASRFECAPVMSAASGIESMGFVIRKRNVASELPFGLSASRPPRRHRPTASPSTIQAAFPRRLVRYRSDRDGFAHATSPSRCHLIPIDSLRYSKAHPEGSVFGPFSGTSRPCPNLVSTAPIGAPRSPWMPGSLCARA